MSWAARGLEFVEPAIRDHGVEALGAVIYLESLGLPLPGESSLVASGLLASRGDLSLARAFLAAWAGAVLGDSTGYAIGRFGGRRLLLRFGPRIGLTEQRLEQAEALFRARGFYIVMAARFFYLLRQVNGLVAGSVAMPWHRFFVANAIGAGLWVSVWLLGPYFFTEQFVGHTR
jgi:membrane protein DedA with SNARE-associated domain